jgi:ribosomal protein S24E
MGEIMKLEIKSRKQNPLMKREKALAVVEHSGKATPSRKDILKELAKSLKVKEDLIIIERIITRSGKTTSEIKVHVYKKASDIPNHKIEMMKRRLERSSKKEKPPEKPPEPKPEETPQEKPEEAEPQKEEAPEEEPPKEEAEEPPEDKKEEPPEEPEEKPPEEPGEEPEKKEAGTE